MGLDWKGSEGKRKRAGRSQTSVLRSGASKLTMTGARELEMEFEYKAIIADRCISGL